MEYVTFKENGTVQEIKKSRLKETLRVHVFWELLWREELRDLSMPSKGTLWAAHNCIIIGEQSDIKRTSDDGG